MQDEAARALAESILAPGEKLLWVQAAPPWPIAQAGISMAVVLGVLLSTVVIFRKKIDAPTAFGRWWLRTFVAALFVVFGFGVGFGVFQAVSAWSTAYAVTDTRVVIVNSPWLWRRDFGPDSFTRYGITEGAIDFEWSRGRRSRYRYSEHLYGLTDPEAVAALITTELAPQAQRIDDNRAR